MAEEELFSSPQALLSFANKRNTKTRKMMKPNAKAGIGIIHSASTPDNQFALLSPSRRLGLRSPSLTCKSTLSRAL